MMDTLDTRGLSMIGDGSVILEVAGELTVPNMSSEKELQEVLLTKKYVLDLRRTEIRMSDSVRREVYEALGVEEEEAVDLVKKSVFLNGSITNAPPGTNELVRSFLPKGTREQHFRRLMELAQRRRADLERDFIKKGASRQPQLAGGETAARQVDRRPQRVTTVPSSDRNRGQKRRDLNAAATAGAVGEERGAEGLKMSGPTKGAAADAPSGGTGSNHFNHPYDVLTTFRSATTASELDTFRSKSGGTSLE